MALDPNIAAEIDLLRQRSREGTMTLDECRRAIEILRSGRMFAQAQSKSSRKGPAPVIDAQALLDDL